MKCDVCKAIEKLNLRSSELACGEFLCTCDKNNPHPIVPVKAHAKAA